MAIKNIVFDIGKVLKGWNTDLTNLFGEEIGRQVERAIWETGWWVEMDRGVIEEQELFRKMIAAMPEREKEIRYVLDHLSCVSEVYPYAIPWVKSLKEEGYSVYYLSNYSDWLRKHVPETLGFLPLMDGGVFSCDIKVIKPDLEIYRYLCRKYNLKAEECLFIDDRQENVDGAIRAGMHSLCFEKESISKPQIEEYLRLYGDPEARMRSSVLPDPGKKRRILVYGDSNTYGWDPRSAFGEPYDAPWPTLLAEDPAYEVISQGEPGREIPHTAYQIRMMKEVIEERMPLDLLILMLGTNDLLSSSEPAAGKIAERMDHLLRKICGLMPGRILLLCPPAVAIGDVKYGKVCRELATEYKILADKYEIGFADAAEAEPEMAFDGVHLTEEGHRRLAEWLRGR